MKNEASPLDYLASATLLAIYASSSEVDARYSYTQARVHQLAQAHAGATYNESFTRQVLSLLSREGALQFMDDPFADALVLTSDSEIRSFFTSSPDASIYARSWYAGIEWLKTAFAKPAFWESLSAEGEGAVPMVVGLAPSADGFVDFGDNYPQVADILSAIEAADEVVRSDNKIDEESRSWVRVHLEAGLSLIRKGGKVLKDALIGTVIKPLQEALKYVVEENAKGLIQMALKFLVSFF